MREVFGIGLPEWLWLAFLLYWMLAGHSTAPTRVRESRIVRIASSGILLLGGVLLFGSMVPLRPLDRHFVPAVAWISWTGVALTAAGLALAVWARVHLGRNWSGEVTLKMGHHLVRTGPYARIRHPIYSGILLALVGTALWLGDYRALLGLALVLAGLLWKARREESLLMCQFGENYAHYRQRTGMLLPPFRHR